MVVSALPILLLFVPLILFPFFVGRWAIIKHREDEHIVTLGGMTMVLGILVGVLSAAISPMNWFYDRGEFLGIFFATAIFELVFLPTMVLGGIRVKKDIVSGGNWRHSAGTLSVLLAAILITAGVGANLIRHEVKGCHFSYTVDITSYALLDYYLFVPLPLFGGYGSYNVSDFVENLEFINGDGEFSVVDTEHGIALRVSSNASATVHVEGDSAHPSINEFSLENTSGPWREQYWVFLNKTFPGIIVLDVSARDNCHCRGAVFDLSATIEANGWGSHEGAFGEWVC